jgi:hypothetical protein
MEPHEATDNTRVTAPPALAAPPATAPPAPAAPPISDEHLRQLAASHAATKKIRRAITVARTDGWSLAFFAALTVLFGLTSVSSLLIGAGLGIIATVELYGAARLRKLDPRITHVLGYNQVALGCLLAAYALWRIYQETTGAGAFADYAASTPDVAELLKPYEDVIRELSMWVYGGLIAVAVFAQGGLALYYFTRKKYVEAYLSQTPEWVVAVQKAGSLV